MLENIKLKLPSGVPSLKATPSCRHPRWQRWPQRPLRPAGMRMNHRPLLTRLNSNCPPNLPVAVAVAAADAVAVAPPAAGTPAATAAAPKTSVVVAAAAVLFDD
ncbi:hypothetical protein Vafri_17522 [Volvox africanus]|uniref:Uncharacterized protein n=1 Tax=Volvox africanus TaxID=51714 RepID=A0A8J4FA71_9CHLO|nr:hypothetical protein Vafri_17522 [Volvox africanus]